MSRFKLGDTFPNFPGDYKKCGDDANPKCFPLDGGGRGWYSIAWTVDSGDYRKRGYTVNKINKNDYFQCDSSNFGGRDPAPGEFKSCIIRPVPKDLYVGLAQQPATTYDSTGKPLQGFTKCASEKDPCGMPAGNFDVLYSYLTNPPNGGNYSIYANINDGTFKCDGGMFGNYHSGGSCFYRPHSDGTAPVDGGTNLNLKSGSDSSSPDTTANNTNTGNNDAADKAAADKTAADKAASDKTKKIIIIISIVIFLVMILLFIIVYIKKYKK